MWRIEMSSVRTLALGALMIVGVAGVSAAQSTTNPPTRAQRSGEMQGRRGGGRGFGADLNLTDAQKAQIKTIREKYMPQQMELRKAAQAVGGPPDEATRSKMMDLQSKQSAEIRAVLTADQQVVFDKNAADMKARMEARRNGSG